MNLIFLLTVFIVGASGIIAQILILRELLVNFQGNELTLGIILANWLLSEACGVFVMGRWADKVKNKLNLFLILQVFFAVFLPASLTLSRLAKVFAGIPYAEALSLYAVIIVSFAALFPAGFIHAALFSVSCKIYAKFSSGGAGPVSRVYFWETFGTLLGGLALAYFLIPVITPFQAVFIVSFINLFISLLFLRNAYWITQILIFSLCLLAGFLGIGGFPQKFDWMTLQKKWGNARLISCRNSVYGNIALTREGEQNTFYYNGLPVIAVPYPDIALVQEFANIPMLLAPHPRKVLVACSGAGGLLNEALKHPVESVDYVELDPLLIRMLKDHPDPLSASEFSDKRLNLKFSDARLYLKANQAKYDVILLGLSRPSELSTNRFFSREFFSLAKSRLDPGGIFALWLPGSSSYLSRELIDVNACVIKALQSVFSFVRVVPGDYNIVISSDSPSLEETGPSALLEEAKKRGVSPPLLTKNHLEYLFDAKRQEWFWANIKKSKTGINSDLVPEAVFQMLIFWTKQSAPFAASLLQAAQKLDFIWLAGFIILAIGLIYVLWGRRKMERFSWSFCIASTGFFAMLATLVLSFSYQAAYGYLYHRIGIMISVFMAGASLGSILMGSWLVKIKRQARALIYLEGAIIAQVAGLCALFASAALRQGLTEASFAALFFACGAFCGMEFPLVSALYLRKERKVGRVTGILYAMDLLGGWAAGILGGIILVPLYGVFKTCLLALLIKSFSFLCVSFLKNQG